MSGKKLGRRIHGALSSCPSDLVDKLNRLESKYDEDDLFLLMVEESAISNERGGYDKYTAWDKAIEEVDKRLERSGKRPSQMYI